MQVLDSVYANALARACLQQLQRSLCWYTDELLG